MEKQINYVEDITNRYVYQVSKHLANNTKKDIEQELKTLISDMLEERTHGNTPSKEDIDTILLELGNPMELANKYRDKSRYLISPTIFPVWQLILKIVLGAVLLGIAISSVIGLLSTDQVIWYEYIGDTIVTLFGGVFMAFAWVTLIFAIIDWKGVNIKELTPEWDIASLPPASTHEVSIPIWEPIVEIVFTVLIMLIFLLSPEILGAYSIHDGVTIIPIFDLDVLKDVLPLILLCLGIGLLKSIWELVDGTYSTKYGVFTLVTNIIEIILTVIIFKAFSIWNPDFIDQVNSLFKLNADANLYEVWNTITNNFVIFLILVYILDTATTLYKCFKAEGSYFIHI